MREHVERHFDHADGALDQRLAGGDHGLRLLAAQHGHRDLGGIGKVRKAAFIDGDARDLEPLDQFGAQFGANLVMVAAQGDFLVLEVVIGIARADGAHGRLDLDHDESLVIIDVEQGLGGIGHAPDHLGCHLDGVSAQIVDLDLVGDDVVGAHAEFFLAKPWPHPAQAGFAVGALVGTKHRDDGGLIGLQDVEALGEQDEGNDAHKRNRGQHPHHRQRRCSTSSKNQEEQQHAKGEIAAEGLS